MTASLHSAHDVTRRNGFHAWLQLFRPPNLLTVPGDPLAGYFVALGEAQPCAMTVLPAVAASLFFYAAGLLLNDLVDMREDRVHASNRPLASGQVPVKPAWLVCVVLFLLALAASAILGRTGLLIGLLLVALILAYNLKAKMIPIVGVFVMGLCRGLSFLLGASQTTSMGPRVVLPFAVIVVYISAVTALATHERSLGQEEGVSGNGPITPATIGLLISGLLVLQSALILTSSGYLAARVVSAALLLLWPVNRWLAKSFYAS